MCHSEQVSEYEMWKKKAASTWRCKENMQDHNGWWKTQSTSSEDDENRIWEDTTWQGERIDMEKLWSVSRNALRHKECDQNLRIVHRPEKMVTKEDGKMFKRIQILEECRVPVKDTKDWKIEGQKKKDHQEEIWKIERVIWGWWFQDPRKAAEYCKEEHVGRQRSVTQRRWQSSAGTQCNAWKTFSAAGCKRLWKNKMQKWKGWAKESNRKKAKVGKERWREKERGLKSKEDVWIGCPILFSMISASWMSGRVTEIPWIFAVCVCGVFFCDFCVCNASVCECDRWDCRFWSWLWICWIADLFFLWKTRFTFYWKSTRHEYRRNTWENPSSVQEKKDTRNRIRKWTSVVKLYQTVMTGMDCSLSWHKWQSGSGYWGAGILPSWVRRARYRHETHCIKRKRRKVSKTIPHVQFAGTEWALDSQCDVMEWVRKNACHTRARVSRAQSCCLTF